ncbi:MAG: hypothetical protein J5742_03635 [Alphaproteobacteria bacterium]|nr:hypothetical protein [Alphaproteobacteria bacterium]
MIKKENITKKYAYFIHERFAGTIFALAPFLDIWFDNKEIGYIETKMRTHKLYRLVNGNVAGISSRDKKLFNFQRSWLISFLNDPEIPVGVRAFIICYIGHEQACMKIDDQYDTVHRYANSIAYEFLAERWMEICH